MDISRIRTLAGAAILAGLLAGSTAVASPAAALGDESPVPEGGNYVVATGSVERDGVPVPEADVMLIAWPLEDPANPLPDGAAVPTLHFRMGKTDGAGRFVASLDPTLLSADFVPATGVDFELVVADATHEATWWFTGQLQGASWHDMKTSGGELLPENVTMDLDRATASSANSADDVVVDEHDNESVGQPVSVHVQERGMRMPALATDPCTYIDPCTLPGTPLPGTEEEGASMVPDPDLSATETALDNDVVGCGKLVDVCVVNTCWQKAGNWHSGLYERFASVYGWSGAKATLTSTYGLTHQLGVGVYASGAWSASGSLSRSLSASASTDYTDRGVYNRINYRDYHLYGCDGSYQGTARRPVSVHSLHAAAISLVHQTYNWTATSCTKYFSGTYTKSKGTNLTYSGGVDIGPINVSARGSYDQGLRTAWSVTSATRLCGNTSYGWVSSPNAAASQL
jgi:hypothetical protein